ncbi:uncharacterized protein LOC141884405 isoform X2 [Acropora palmata]|uniref:uncharacterized protein LOC141884405 isoform X2 n=1 Tax=Acropora palmata TaxID=6131 RepID=UPI003DA083D9
MTTDKLNVVNIESDPESLDDIYEVERILDAKRKDGKMYYKVRWEGYESEEDSWEPMENLITCQELVDKYWELRKEGYKKRGRKPKRLRRAPEEGSGTSDTDEGLKDQNNVANEMPPRKGKRGRPPKTRILSDSENQTPDHGHSSSLESSGKNSTKKKRRRRNGDDTVPSELATRLLLLEHDIAPVGMTRQASKELALVSMRQKHDGETAAISNSEGGSLPLEVASAAESKRDCFSKLEIERKDDFEVIEISSLSTDDEETLTSSQESRAATIYISSQSDSESESGKKDATVTHVEETTQGEAFVEETSSENINEKDKVQNSAIVPLETGVAKLKRILSNDSYRSFDICLRNSGKAVSEIEQREDFVESTAMSCESLEKDDLNDHAMDLNSNLTAKTSAVDSNPSEWKSQSLSEKHTRGKILASYETTVCTERNDEEFPGTTTTSSSKSSGGKLSVDKLPSSFESTDDRKVTNDMASSETKRWALSQLDSIPSAPKRRIDKIVANTGKAKRTSGRPKSIRDHRKRLPSLDDAPGLKRDSSVSKKTAMFIAESEAGKIERQTLASTTADLLPMQNKTTAVPLMDGDLIGMIIQDNQKVDDSKKTQTATESGKKEGKTRVDGHSETLKFKPWDSGMEDISDGEDDLSDFEFDLDDYSPSSFFNDVEELNTIERTPSPVVDPLNLSSAALKHAIREGDIAQVRGALAVPGLNPDTIDTVSGMNLLTLAATYGQDEIVKLLLRRGAGVNYTDQNRNGMTALIQAAEQGFPKTVQVLLESGAHINCQTTAGETALMRVSG